MSVTTLEFRQDHYPPGCWDTCTVVGCPGKAVQALRQAGYSVIETCPSLHIWLTWSPIPFALPMSNTCESRI